MTSNKIFTLKCHFSPDGLRPQVRRVWHSGQSLISCPSEEPDGLWLAWKPTKMMPDELAKKLPNNSLVLPKRLPVENCANFYKVN